MITHSHSDMYQLRPYQQECIDIIREQKPGAYLVQMATGLGKSLTFASIPRQGRVLILSHREELVEQPRKYYNCSYGVERAGKHSHGEDVISASVQTMVKRLNNFPDDAFDVLITDEAHHATAKTYRKIYQHFKPRLHLGFTATPNRSDNVGLSSVYSKIIFQRDLRWGIEHGYLCDITCLRVNIGYDLSAVHTRNGDYAPGELDEAMDGTADAIAQAYREYANGATLIFAASVHHAEEIAARIDGAVVVTGKTKQRAEIVKQFTDGEIPVIVNCMVFTEGTDVPRVETVIMARPTQSEIVYAQAVGRGLRPYPGKENLTLIDCVGVTGKTKLCTAPSLIGIDISTIPDRLKGEIQGDLFDLPIKAISVSDCPESWIRNVEIVELWAKEQEYNTHRVNYFKWPDGRMTVSLLDGKKLEIPAPDALGNVILSNGEQVNMQIALDRAYQSLTLNAPESRYIWDLDMVKKWSWKPASEKQLAQINRRYPNFDTSELTKGQASQILNRMFTRRRCI